MAKGQYLSSHQKGIVRRYYANLDTLALQKLAEAVGELYLCDDPKKSAKLWASVEKALPKVVDDPADVAKLIAGKSIKDLAAIVNDLSGKR